MKLWDKIKNWFSSFMSGRYGADQLSTTLVYGALALNLLMALTGLSLLGTLGFAALVWALFRMLSRNTQKRYAENAAFLAWVRPRLKSAKQAFVRLKNSKKYVVFETLQVIWAVKSPARKINEE